MTLLFRYTALRISDVAVLAKARVSDGEIFVRAEKNGKPVRLPVPGDLMSALDNLPFPRGADPECPYFFWTGHGSVESMIRDVRRTMVAVFRKAQVTRGHPHKFRHTLAVDLLVNGGSIEDVASILGDSPATIRKHYAPWTESRQERISSLMQAVFPGPKLAQSSKEAGSCRKKKGDFGGPGEIRTHDLFHAMEARSQLRHRPKIVCFFSLYHTQFAYAALTWPFSDCLQ
jgi:hypothetical protein